MKKNKIIISDVSLRDGNHAVEHTISKDIIKNYCKLIDKTNVKIVEVGHGNGLGASTLSIGRSLISDELALKTCRLHSYKYAVITPDDIVIPPKHKK